MRGMRGFRSLRGLRPIAVADPVLSMEEVAQKEDKRFESWIDRVGETRAQEANAISKEGTGSTTLPELLVEVALRKAGLNYRAQVDLGWSRPDFVVFDRGAVIVRVQGDYWHSRPGAVTNDAMQKDRLERHTVFGVPVRAVVDIWEREIYESEQVVARELGIGGSRMDSAEPAPTPTYPQVVLATPDLWGFWRFEDGVTTVMSPAWGPAGVYARRFFTTTGRAQGEIARMMDDTNATITPGEAFGDWTIELWLRRVNLANGAIVSLGTSPQSSLTIDLSATLSVNGVSTGFVVSDANARWYHIVAMRAGTTGRLYVDGRLEASLTVSSDTTQDDIVRVNQVGEFAGGMFFDELAIYTRALSADEVDEHHKAGL